MPGDEADPTFDGLDGRVAIVTGAGRGLGRAEAIELARHGARVVVNDVGAGLRTGRTENRAADVVDEIRAEGGTATVHTGDVSDFEQARSLIDLAVTTYGQLDVLVNNAGNLRERMLFNMSEDEWDDVIRVHLRGHFCASRWAASYWRERSRSAGRPLGARVVNTSSEAFLNGAVGQPNYAAAKAGIVQLTLNTMYALEQYGVTANAICPRARTRMTEPSGRFDAKVGDLDLFAPENVAPLVAWLASEQSDDVNGQVFVAYGARIALLAPPTVRRRFDHDEAWSVHSVGDALRPHFAEADRSQNFATSIDLAYL